MTLKFSWCNTQIGFMAVCTSDVLNPSGISPLSCLLMDDGGIDHQSASAWLKEGIARVDKALSGEADQCITWAREDWGAEFEGSETRIYSLHEDGPVEKIHTIKFRCVLSQWLSFICAEGEVKSVEIDF